MAERSGNDSLFSWKRIHGFDDPPHFYRFQRAIDEAIQRGVVREVEMDSNYGRALIYGGRWFENPTNGEIWRLVEPEPPFMGLWERVLGYSVTAEESPTEPPSRQPSDDELIPDSVLDRVFGPESKLD